ncbi:MAG: amidohydrolase family protein [Clostridia bacterium]|nr:amidohydrolase family protein [Clostridia bacterium]MBQ7907802.1 amidohydrolase family protein [Clostridia bacterium]
MIIDFHTHIFPDKIAGATIKALSENASIPAHSDGTMAGLLSSMEKSGVNISINLPVVTRPKQMDSINAFAQQINRERATQGGIISFAGIHPDTEDTDLWLEKIKGQGFLGIKLHPDYQGVFFDDPRYIKILKKAKELDLITVTHAGLDGAFVGQEIKCTPRRVISALDKIGGYDRLVLAHLGGNELYSEVYELLAGEDVYFDTSYVLKSTSRDDLCRMVERHGEDKILFATDSPWQDQGEMIDILRGYDLGALATDKILSKNAIKLIGEIC